MSVGEEVLFDRCASAPKLLQPVIGTTEVVKWPFERGALTAHELPHLGPEAFDQLTEGGWESLYRLPLREARDQVIEQFESSYLTTNLRTHGGNVLRLSQAAGVSRTLIYRLLERHGIKRESE